MHFITFIIIINLYFSNYFKSLYKKNDKNHDRNVQLISNLCIYKIESIWYNNFNILDLLKITTSIERNCEECF